MAVLTPKSVNTSKYVKQNQLWPITVNCDKVGSQSYLAGLSQNCQKFVSTNVHQMIIKQRLDAFFQRQFCNIFTKIQKFSVTLKKYELPKTNNIPKYCEILVLVIIFWQPNSMPTASGFWTIPLLTLLKRCPRAKSFKLQNE